jgi:hypothetical protein
MRVHYRCDYKGFEIHPHAIKLPQGGYAASVTLIPQDGTRTASEFALPLDATVNTEDEALQHAVLYGFELVDGFVLPS